jgi:hypothetical protein
MKTAAYYFSMLVLALLAMVSGIGCNRSSPDQTSTSQRTLSLDDQALAEARKYWTDHTTQCGETHVARAEYGDRSGGDIQQYTSVKFTATPRQLTEADRLNGIEWDGTAEGRATSKRGSHFSNFYTTMDRTKLVSPNRLAPEPGHSQPGPWSPWEPSSGPIWTLQLQKVGSQWSVSPVRWAAFVFFEAWPCSELPGITSTSASQASTAGNPTNSVGLGSAETFRGAWFEVWVPPNFQVIRSLRSTTSEGYDSAFFRSPDQQVEFYIYSPQWNGEPTDIAINKTTETQLTSESKTSATNVVTWLTVAARDGSYTRTYQDTRTRDGSVRWVIGIKYADQAAFNRHKADYLRFKSSLEQFAD